MQLTIGKVWEFFNARLLVLVIGIGLSYLLVELYDRYKTESLENDALVSLLWETGVDSVALLRNKERFELTSLKELYDAERLATKRLNVISHLIQKRYDEKPLGKPKPDLAESFPNSERFNSQFAMPIMQLFYDAINIRSQAEHGEVTDDDFENLHLKVKDIQNRVDLWVSALEGRTEGDYSEILADADYTLASPVNPVNSEKEASGP